MTIEIKSCTVAELPLLKEISIETFTDTFGAQNTPEDLAEYLATAYADEKLTEEINTPDSHFYLLFKDDELAGYLKLNTEAAQTESVAENALEVERIYIRSSFKRQGLGRKLIELAIEIAEKDKRDNIWLGVWEHNENAIKFYEKMGFEVVGQHDFVLGDDVQTDLVMCKKLK